MSGDLRDLGDLGGARAPHRFPRLRLVQFNRDQQGNYGRSFGVRGFGKGLV